MYININIAADIINNITVSAIAIVRFRLPSLSLLSAFARLDGPNFAQGSDFASSHPCLSFFCDAAIRASLFVLLGSLPPASLALSPVFTHVSFPWTKHIQDIASHTLHHASRRYPHFALSSQYKSLSSSLIPKTAVYGILPTHADRDGF